MSRLQAAHVRCSMIMSGCNCSDLRGRDNPLTQSSAGALTGAYRRAHATFPPVVVSSPPKAWVVRALRYTPTKRRGTQGERVECRRPHPRQDFDDRSGVVRTREGNYEVGPCGFPPPPTRGQAVRGNDGGGVWAALNAGNAASGHSRRATCRSRRGGGLCRPRPGSRRSVPRRPPAASRLGFPACGATRAERRWTRFRRARIVCRRP